MVRVTALESNYLGAALPPTHCLTFIKSLHLPTPQFSHLWSGNGKSTVLVLAQLLAHRDTISIFIIIISPRAELSTAVAPSHGWLFKLISVIIRV